MQAYQFTLILATRDGSEFDIETASDALFEAGCDDGTPGVSCGVPHIDFTREAESFQDAVASAIGDVAKSQVPLMVLRVEPDDFVTAAEIAKRLKQSRESIRLYTTGERGPGGFPAPVTSFRQTSPLYRWGEVATWAHERLGREVEGVTDTQTIGAINAALELKRYLGKKSDINRLLKILG